MSQGTLGQYRGGAAAGTLWSSPLSPVVWCGVWVPATSLPLILPRMPPVYTVDSRSLETPGGRAGVLPGKLTVVLIPQDKEVPADKEKTGGIPVNKAT